MGPLAKPCSAVTSLETLWMPEKERKIKPATVLTSVNKRKKEKEKKRKKSNGTYPTFWVYFDSWFQEEVLESKISWERQFLCLTAKEHRQPQKLHFPCWFSKPTSPIHRFPPNSANCCLKQHQKSRGQGGAFKNGEL